MEREHSHGGLNDSPRSQRISLQQSRQELRFPQLGKRVRPNSPTQTRTQSLLRATKSATEECAAPIEEFSEQSLADCHSHLTTKAPLSTHKASPSTTQASLDDHSQTVTNILPLAEMQQGAKLAGVHRSGISDVL